VGVAGRWVGRDRIAIQTFPPLDFASSGPSTVSLLDVRTARVQPIDRHSNAWAVQIEAGDGRLLVPSASGLRAYDDRGRLRYHDFRGTGVARLRLVGDHAYVNLWSGPIAVVDVRTGRVVNTVIKTSFEILRAPE
jgi:hypothetical protein